MKKWTTTAVTAMAFLMAGRLASQALSIGGRFDASVASWTFKKHNPLGGGFEGWKAAQVLHFGGGLPVEFRPSRAFALQAEVNFVRKGFAMTRRDSFPSGWARARTVELDYRYLELPFLLKIHGLLDDQDMYALVGASWSRARRADIRYSFADCLDGECETGGHSIQYGLAQFPRSRTDWGWYLGAGWTGSASVAHPFIEVRRYIGRKKMNEGGAPEAYRNRAWLVSFGALVTIAWS